MLRPEVVTITVPARSRQTANATTPAATAQGTAACAPIAWRCLASALGGCGGSSGPADDTYLTTMSR
jgi:hypothetical protein